jgi:hypothetical protein
LALSGALPGDQSFSANVFIKLFLVNPDSESDLSPASALGRSAVE